MQSTIRFTRRIMTLLLAVVMLFGTLMTTADAANRDNVRHYDTYMCIGDSIAAGFYIDGQRAGYYRTRMPGAYHDIIANATPEDIAALREMLVRMDELDKKNDVEALSPLARDFHSYYNSCRVSDPEKPELTNQRLGLVNACMITMKNALDLIGVSAPEKM